MWHKLFSISNALKDVDDSNLYKKYNDMNEDDSSDDNTMLEGRGKTPMIFSLLFRRFKFAFIGLGAGVFMCIVFMMVIMVPVMAASDLIGGNTGSGDDVLGGGGDSGSPSGGSAGNNYTPVYTGITHWWPIGSSETTIVDGITYASGPPLSTTITSNFNSQESFRTSTHKGLDIGNGGNGPGVVNVIATKDGTVTYPYDTSQTSYSDNGYYGNYADGGGFGNYVAIRHNDGTFTVYAHLSKDTITVFAGDTVKQGQVIAKMGNSGSSTGTHLHFEVRVNDIKMYPLDYISTQNTRP